MSNITDTIDNLRDQVSDLETELEDLREANKEWHELMNDHDVDEINKLVDFDQEFGTEDVRSFLNDHDIDELKDALRYNSIDELSKAYNKIDEYGDPEEMAEKLERLEEEVAEYQQGDDPNDNPDECVNSLDLTPDQARVKELEEENKAVVAHLVHIRMWLKATLDIDATYVAIKTEGN